MFINCDLGQLKLPMIKVTVAFDVHRSSLSSSRLLSVSFSIDFQRFQFLLHLLLDFDVLVPMQPPFNG